MNSENDMARIVRLDELFNENLTVPGYQRPYKWSLKSINNLIGDLREIGQSDYEEYRLGTVIAYKKREDDECRESLEIVDGQQRIITLILLLKALSKCNKEQNYNIPKELERGEYLKDKVTRFSIRRNYNEIIGKVRNEADYLERALGKITFVLIIVDRLDKAFQIFDCQNYRGKKLYPHDLLKAYHLRCISETLNDSNAEWVAEIVNNWESVNQEDIQKLFDSLHRIVCWTTRADASPFTEHEIEEFKGIEKNKIGKSPYACRVEAAENRFQIGDWFFSGKDFFSYAEHYLKLKRELESNLEMVISIKIKSEVEDKYLEILNRRKTGFDHAFGLFMCITLRFLDKFGQEVFSGGVQNPYLRYLMQWSFIIRMRKSSLSFASINRYVLNKDNDSINLFELISKIKYPEELFDRTLSSEGIKSEWEFMKDLLF